MLPGPISDPTAPTLTSLSLGAESVGLRVDRYLADALEVSRAQARRLLARGAVSLAGRQLGYRDKGLSLPGSGVLEIAAISAARDERALPAPSAPAISVLGEGPGWIAVDKPAGCPVHPLAEDETGTVLNALLALRPQIHGIGEAGLRSGVLHRLDTDTSGVLLFATAQPQWDHLRTAFQLHRVEKVYRAIAVGRLQADGRELQFDLAVARHRPARVRVLDGSWGKGKRAYRVRQSVRVIEQLVDATLIEVRIVTGFLHQIRVTLAHMGAPIVGDALYGNEAALARGAPRQLLHAARLRFEDIDVESPDPDDFRESLQRLRSG